MKLNKIADLYALSRYERDSLMDSLEKAGYITATQSDVGLVIMEEVDSEVSDETIEE